MSTGRYGRFDLSPRERLPLGGYTDRRGVAALDGGEPLFGRVVAIGNVVIVSLEMLTIPESFLRELKARLPGLELFVTATHTHCAPDSQMLNERMTFPIPGIATFRKEQLPLFADRVAAGIRGVAGPLPPSPPPQRAREGGAGALALRQAEVNLNRGRRQGAEPIKTVTQIEIGPLRMVHYAAHATIFGSKENRTRGDWPGALAQRENVLPLIGAIGDVSPAGEGQTVTQRVDSMVRGLSTAVAEARERRMRAELRMTTATIDLPKAQPHPTFAASNRVPEALAQLVVGGFAPPAAEVTVVRLGEVALIGIPGEPTSALARRIMRQAQSQGIKVPLVVSHVNGWMGYILEPEDYDRGGYEATLAFHGRDVADRVVDACRTALAASATRERPGS